MMYGVFNASVTHMPLPSYKGTSSLTLNKTLSKIVYLLFLTLKNEKNDNAKTFFNINFSKYTEVNCGPILNILKIFGGGILGQGNDLWT